MRQLNKKLVGLLVTVALIVVILIGVAVGSITLKKSDGTETAQQRVAVANAEAKQRQANQQTNSQQTQGNIVSPSKEVEKPVVETQPNEDLVNRVLEQSKRLDTTITVTENDVILTPSEGVLRDELYEVQGVVRKLELLESSNRIQAQYKAEIEIVLGDKSVYLDYFTTVNSIGSLQENVKVLVKYQLTDKNKLVIKGLSLLN